MRSVCEKLTVWAQAKGHYDDNDNDNMTNYLFGFLVTTCFTYKMWRCYRGFRTLLESNYRQFCCPNAINDFSTFDKSSVIPRNTQKVPPTLGSEADINSRLAFSHYTRRDEMATSFFDSIKNGDTELVDSSTILEMISQSGIAVSDPRLSGFVSNLRALRIARNEKQHRDNLHGILMNKAEFGELTRGDLSMLLRVAVNDFCIPDFLAFKEIVRESFDECKEITGGCVANYIPQLAKMDPNLWAASICTVDGQRASFGDCKIPFTLQSSSKPLSYALALTELGPEDVHKYVGYEPSGVPFNQISLNHKCRPHNPLINAGAIAVASLLQQHESRPERFVYVHKKFSDLAGGEQMGFNNAVYLSERATADRNMAIAYYMRENSCFPKNSDLEATMDLYFQLCSLESTCEASAVIYSTLANGGINPLTGERILSSDAVRDTLSVMHSCGMYDFSGQFAFQVGLPAKSGVSGVIVLVIPNLMGIALWSPRINHQGNSVRGIAFCEKMVRNFIFHNYESQLHSGNKIDPRKQPLEDKTHSVVNLLFAANGNDVGVLRRCMLAGYNLNMADYDGRTGLHVAASAGALECVRFLVEVARVNTQSTDRWGHTPESEAQLFKRAAVIEYFESLKNKDSADQ